MSLWHLVLAIALVGLALWAVNAWIPMEANIKKILNIVVIVALVLYCLFAFGVFDHLNDVRVPRVP